MGDFLSKFENFIFDILGLVLPGFIFILILASPVCLLNISKIPHEAVDASYILSELTTLSRVLENQWVQNTNLLIGIVLVLSYLLGHLIKVFSIIKYDFLSAIFDKFINKFVTKGYKSLKTKLGRDNPNQTDYQKYTKALFSPFKSTFIKVFTFSSPDYVAANEPLKAECIAIINERLGTNYPNEWYSVYKLSTLVNIQESQRSLAGTFLAKYNLYRSLSFIFLFTALYYKFFLNSSSNYIPLELSKIGSLILLAALLLWFTFNYKFKRYWTLCGNETLVSLFYFLNKKKLNGDV